MVFVLIFIFFFFTQNFFGWKISIFKIFNQIFDSFFHCHRYIRGHMEQRAKDLEETGRTSFRKYNSFTLIPITTFKRHHIAIDNQGFYHLLKKIGSKHEAMHRRNGEWKQLREMKPKDYAALWRHYFKIESIERNPENEHAAVIQFDNYIETDGVAASFKIVRKREVIVRSEEERKATLQRKLRESEQEYGFDTGLKLVYGGVRCHPDGKEDNIRLTSKRYHQLTGYYKRQKWREKLTREIDDVMRAEREILGMIGPRSQQYEVYAEHILKHFNNAIAAYTQYEYALQDFLQYCATNRFLDRLATELINGKRTFVFVGSAFLPANSPAKGYRRNKIRDLFQKMARRRLCTVHEVDEFRTTKLCSLCFTALEPARKRGRIHFKFRYYLCRRCNVQECAMQAVGGVHSKKNNRLLSEQRHERPRLFYGKNDENQTIVGARMASKFKYYQKRDANGRNVTWNRDTNAARNIRYKGTY